MLKIAFEIDGREVSPDNLEDTFERALLASIEDSVRSKLQGIRDPTTGEFPVVAVRGRNLDNLTFEISGSDELIALVRTRLQSDDAMIEEGMEDGTPKPNPCAFLCHASEDKDIARKIASELLNRGIDTFFDEWEIGPGDSIRQKIDAGLSSCTHFVVLLSPISITKHWVNTEIDAAFMKRIEGACHFIPLRHGLEPTKLPPLLAAMHSPALEEYERDIKGLIDFIHGVSRKPPLGPAPSVIEAGTGGRLGLSPAAEAIVRLAIERSEHGTTLDPFLDPEELQREIAVSDDDLIDAVDELEGQGFVVKHVLIGGGSLGFAHLTPGGALFAAFDKHFTDWNPEKDALRIAAELVNGEGNARLSQLAERYGWLPRRMNPAVHYLMDRDLVTASESVGSHPWCRHWIAKNNGTRRLLRSRS